MRRAYQTDISVAQWAYVQAHLPSPEAATGRPWGHPLREIVDTVFCIVKSGCAWRLLRHDFAPRKAVYQPLQGLASRRNLGGDARRFAQAGAGPRREEPPAERGASR